MQILNAINDRIAAFPTREEAAKFLGISIQTLGKFQSGNGNLPLQAIQKVIDALIAENKLRYDPKGIKAQAPAPEPKPSLAEMTEQTQESGTPDSPVAEAALAGPAPQNREDALRILVAEMDHLDPDSLRQLAERAGQAVRSKITLAVPVAPGVSVTGPNLLAIAGSSRNFRCATLRVEKGFSVEDAMNKLAGAFLEDKGQEWLFFYHPETFVPFGKPDWFRKVTKSPFGPEFLGINALERMCSNRDNLVVGAVYACPQNNGKNAIQPEVDPRDPNDGAVATLVREKGPQNRLLEVPWVGARVMAVHRRAFEKIIATQPEERRPKPGSLFPFFAPSLDQFGNEKRFGALCKEARIEIKLDLAVHCVPAALTPVIADTGRSSK